jgi:hypothetical protein
LWFLVDGVGSALAAGFLSLVFDGLAAVLVFAHLVVSFRSWGVLAQHVGEALASALQVVVDGSPGWGCGLPVGQFRRADGSDGQVDASGRVSSA